MCVRTANQLLTLINGTEHKDKVINIHQQELDNYITDSSKWPDYTELPDNHIDTVIENTASMSEDELVAKGFQLTDTGWVKV